MDEHLAHLARGLPDEGHASRTSPDGLPADQLDRLEVAALCRQIPHPPADPWRPWEPAWRDAGIQPGLMHRRFTSCHGIPGRAAWRDAGIQPGLMHPEVHGLPWQFSMLFTVCAFISVQWREGASVRTIIRCGTHAEAGRMLSCASWRCRSGICRRT